MELYIRGKLVEATPTGRWYLTETGVMGVQFKLPKNHSWEAVPVEYVEEYEIEFPETRFYFNCNSGEY